LIACWIGDEKSKIEVKRVYVAVVVVVSAKERARGVVIFLAKCFRE
jgi:hypothetical protein